MTARNAAFLSLVRCEKAGKYTNLELDAAIRKYGLDESERALYTALVYGVTERAITLDYVISLFSSLPERKIAPAVRVILRLGVYQLLFLDRIPDHAAVSESVELCKRYSRAAAPFVNAVLRTVIRQKDGITYPDPAVRYGLRREVYEMWQEQYGAALAERIAGALNTPARMTLHANTLRLSAGQLREQIECETVQGVLCPDCVRLLEHMPVTDFAPLADGQCFVQDESSAYAASLLDARPGMRVVDACACPGGKSFAVALQMQNQGEILSCDLHENKLSLIRSGADRLGISIIKTRAQDAREYCPEFAEADRVLCDVPCSGLGVIAKKPDLRHKPLSEISHLPEVQYAILENCARYVRHDGLLVYSTCTLNRAENELVIGRFLAHHGEFAPALFDTPDGALGMRTIFPDEYGSDGFFVARLRRNC